MDMRVDTIYDKLVAPKERKILSSFYETMTEFFDVNIWEDIDDEDTVEVLL